MGRKIFFLHPSTVVQNKIVMGLAQEEFEVYAVKDEAKLRTVLKKYPDSIVFAHINEGIRESAWEEWIRGVMGDTDLAGVDIGILTFSVDEKLKHKYTEQIKVRCGYTVIKSDLNTVFKQLITILNQVNAKGRRKYIRVLPEKDANTIANLFLNGTYITGLIKDISVVGFSCAFAEDPDLTQNSFFTDIQIRLQTQLLKTEGIVFGSRMDGEQKTYVILFTQRIDQDVKTKIRKYIQSYLQNKIEKELDKPL